MPTLSDLQPETSYPPSDFPTDFTHQSWGDKSPWFKFYYPKCNDVYRAHVREKYATYIQLVTECAMSRSRYHNEWDVIEEGCGAGFTLAEIRRTLDREGGEDRIVLGLDPDLAVRTLAHHNLAQTGREYPAVYVANPSANETLPATVICGHGVLEHLDDKTISEILASQRERANYVVHYVPTIAYKMPSFGNERLLPANWWIARFAPDSYTLENDNKDLTMIWQGMV